MTQSELYKLFGGSNMQNIANINSWLVLSALVDPAYSSFIGNILYKDGDPIAPCIELARRAFAREGKPEPIFSSNPPAGVTKKVKGEVNVGRRPTVGSSLRFQTKRGTYRQVLPIAD